MGWSGNRRLNARRDANEAEIVDCLRKQGFHVVQINGTGVPDLLVSKRLGVVEPVPGTTRPALELKVRGMCWLVEVKMPKATYKPSQLAFKRDWQGPPIITLRSTEDALKFQVLACETGDGGVK